MDHGRFATSTLPFHEGQVDRGVSEASTGPSHEGQVDHGLFEAPLVVVIPA